MTKIITQVARLVHIWASTQKSAVLPDNEIMVIINIILYYIYIIFQVSTGLLLFYIYYIFVFWYFHNCKT